MDLIGGLWIDPSQPDGEIVNRSPADLDDVVSTHRWSLKHVEAAIAAARQPPPGLELIQRIGAVLKAHEEELARAIARDIGKPLWEARTEAQACANKAVITATDGAKLVSGLQIPNSELRFRPHGILAVLGPFNFPMHLANGHILPALMCGNAVILKPSEVAPHSAEVYAKCLVEAGVPAGAFQLIQGGPQVGAALAAHPAVNGVLFTGSWNVGLAIQKATLGQTKILALEMGGKNAAIVLPDADLDKAAYDVLFSAFVSAGQRCTAASRAIVVGDADRFAKRIAALAQKLSIGHPLDDGVFMGPLASEAALEKFEKGVRGATAETVLESRRLSPRGLRGCYVSPGVHRVRQRTGSPYEREELFGPDLAVYEAASEDEAIEICNATEYGLAASVHTKSADAWERCLARIECGCVNWNAPTVGASGKLPFGGLKRSGNHRPAGLYSALYCAAPVAILKGAAALDRAMLAPGVAWVDE